MMMVCEADEDVVSGKKVDTSKKCAKKSCSDGENES